MRRLHVIGQKNHGKTTLVVELVKEFAGRGVAVGTIKHTHHHHELDVPGKDSYRHRLAGAAVVGILSPSMNAVFLPKHESQRAVGDPYETLASVFIGCRLVLVEGDSQTTAPKIEVWRSEMGVPPLAADDPSILAIVSDDALAMAANVLPRSDICGLADWILNQFSVPSMESAPRVVSPPGP